MKHQSRKNLRSSAKDVEFGFDLTPDIIDGVNTMRHDRSSAVNQQLHKTPRNNTRPGADQNDDFD